MSDFNHALNLTHDGTLILRIPKGYEVGKVIVEEMGTEKRKEYVPDTNVGEITDKEHRGKPYYSFKYVEDGEEYIDYFIPPADLSDYCDKLWKLAYERGKAEGQAEIIRCKDCKKAPKCFGDVVMKSKGGGYIYCPVDYCSEAERRTDE